MTAPLTRHDLDRQQCGNPNCTHEDHSELFLHAGCHMRAGLEVAYRLTTGSIICRCSKCKRFIAEIAVAP